MAFGNRDYGLDAYFVDRQARNLYLFQFKWSEACGQFKESMERLAKDGLPRIFGNALQDPLQNEFLRYLGQDLREHRNLIERVYIQFVFKGDLATVEASQGLSNRREDIENRQSVVEAFFGREIEFKVDFISDKPGLPPPPAEQRHVLDVTDVIETGDGQRRLLVGFVRLMDLSRIYSDLQQRFFDRNIRAALSPDNAPNKRVRLALTDIVLHAKEDPGIFAFRHNGVTLAAERATVQNSRLTLHVPRLLNGAQTVSSLAKFLDDHSGGKI